MVSRFQDLVYGFFANTSNNFELTSLWQSVILTDNTKISEIGYDTYNRFGAGRHAAGVRRRDDKKAIT
jgi:hypothetical protein